MILIHNAQTPLSNVARMGCGSKPTDGGYLILEDDAARDAFIALEPAAAPFVKRYV